MLFWGLCNLKKLRKTGRRVGSRERSERFDLSQTSSLSFLVIVGIYVASSSKLVGNSEIGSVI
jgi:hypothetical protein